MRDDEFNKWLNQRTPSGGKPKCTTKLHQLQLGRFLRLEEQSDLTRRMKRYEPEPA